MPRRIAILFPAPAGGASTRLEDTRFADTAAALRAAGLEVEAAPYSDEAAGDIRTRLLRADGVLVWVNPIEGDRPRAVLNALLAEVADAGVFVSAHPSVIAKMGTKEILYRTREMPWGGDVRHYLSAGQMAAELPGRLAATGACVLKQVRGNGGNGVWKVAPSDLSAGRVRVRHAKRGSAEEEMPLARFLDICAPYFQAGGSMIDQPYQARLAEGMIRCYMVHDRVEGFGEQLINALHPTVAEPGERLYFPPTRPDFQPLKNRLEREWLPEMCRLLDLDRHRLPVIWDADFMYGPKDAAGTDTFVLCEINVSSVYPFPPSALRPIAEATLARVT